MRSVTTLTERSRVGDTIVSEVVRGWGLKPPGGQTGTRAKPRAITEDRHDTALPQALAGPRAAVMKQTTIRRGHSSPRRCEVFDMATITKVRKQIERVSALKGWRMRWHMQ
jgi:hypothetical protein